MLHCALAPISAALQGAHFALLMLLLVHAVHLEQASQVNVPRLFLRTCKLAGGSIFTVARTLIPSFVGGVALRRHYNHLKQLQKLR
jgi:hypothetical protein